MLKRGVPADKMRKMYVMLGVFCTLEIVNKFAKANIIQSVILLPIDELFNEKNIKLENPR